MNGYGSFISGLIAELETSHGAAVCINAIKFANQVESLPGFNNSSGEVVSKCGYFWAFYKAGEITALIYHPKGKFSS